MTDKATTLDMNALDAIARVQALIRARDEFEHATRKPTEKSSDGETNQEPRSTRRT